MAQILRKIAGYQAEFTYQDNALLINIIHPNKCQMLFSRITDHAFPHQLRDLSDNTLQLFEVIKDLADDKIVINPKGQLVFVIVLGKKMKQFGIQLERAQISNEETLKKRVEELQKRLEKKQFEAEFYKEQYNFILKHLQLKPDIQALQQLYGREDIQEMVNEQVKQSRLTMNSSNISNISKVGANLSNIKKQDKKQEFKCPKNHELVAKQTQHPRFRCNICRQSIGQGVIRLRCDSCDFDACKKCTNIPPQNRKYCPKGHGLIFDSATNYLMRLCDKCTKKLLIEKGYSCVTCDYDLCQKCL